MSPRRRDTSLTSPPPMTAAADRNDSSRKRPWMSGLRAEPFLHRRQAGIEQARHDADGEEREGRRDEDAALPWVVDDLMDEDRQAQAAHGADGSERRWPSSVPGIGRFRTSGLSAPRCRTLAACPRTSSSFAVPANTTSRTSRSRCRGTGSSSSPASPAAASPASPSTRSTRRASAATSSRCRRTRASSWGRWRSRTSMPSRASRRPSRSTRRAPAATPARRWARSPRSTTTCACSSRASGTRTAPSAGARSRA